MGTEILSFIYMNGRTCSLILFKKQKGCLVCTCIYEDNFPLSFFLSCPCLTLDPEKRCLGSALHLSWLAAHWSHLKVQTQRLALKFENS